MKQSCLRSLLGTAMALITTLCLSTVVWAVELPTQLVLDNGPIEITADDTGLQVTQGANTYTAAKDAPVYVIGSGGSISATAEVKLTLDSAEPTAVTMGAGGTLTLRGKNTLSGDLTSDGALTITAGAASALTCANLTGTGAVTMNSGSLTATGAVGNVTVNNSAVVAAKDASNLTINGGQVTLSGSLTGTNTISAGKLIGGNTLEVTGLTVKGSGAVTANKATNLTVEADSTAPVTLSDSFATATVKGGEVTAANGAGLTLNGGKATLTGTLNKPTNGSNQVSGGTLVAASASDLGITGGTVQLSGSLTGTNTISAGTLNGGNTLEVTGLTVSGSGTVTANKATNLTVEANSTIPVILSDSFTTATVKGGEVKAASGAGLTLSGGKATLTGTLNKPTNGSNQVSGGTLVAASASDLGISGGEVKLSGSLTGTNTISAGTLSGGDTLTINGLKVSGTGAVTAKDASNTNVAAGTVNLTGTLTASTVGGGTVTATNASGIGVSGGTVTATNASGINVSGGTVTLSGALTPPATGRNTLSGGALHLPAGADLSSLDVSGTGSLVSGTAALYQTTISGLPTGGVVTINNKELTNGVHYLPVSASATYTSKDGKYQATGAITATNNNTLVFSLITQPCTCIISAATYQSGSSFIAPGRPNASLGLDSLRTNGASLNTNNCTVHTSSPAITYTYKIKSDVGTLSGNTLTTNKAGTVSIQAIATANGKTAETTFQVETVAATLPNASIKRGETIVITLSGSVKSVDTIKVNGSDVYSGSIHTGNATVNGNTITLKGFTSSVGSKKIEIAYTLTNGQTSTMNFNVTVDKYIATLPDDLTRTMRTGSTRADVIRALPKTVRVTLDRYYSGVGNTITVDVSGWNCSDYDSKKTGDYDFSATATIPSKYRNDVSFSGGGYTEQLWLTLTLTRSGSDDNNNNNNDGSTKEERMRNYCDALKEEIRDADAGDTVYVDDRFGGLFADVLEELEGTRVTLKIERNAGADFKIYGKNVKPIPSNVVIYSMDELYKIYRNVSSSSSSSSSKAPSASSSKPTTGTTSRPATVTPPPTTVQPIVPPAASSGKVSSAASAPESASSESSESEEIVSSTSEEQSEPDEFETEPTIKPEKEDKKIKPAVWIAMICAVLALGVGLTAAIIIRRRG